MICETTHASLIYLFVYLDLVIVKLALEYGLDLDENSPEVRIIRDQQAAERAAKRAYERAAVEKLNNFGEAQPASGSCLINIPLDESFGTPPSTPEPGAPANPEAGCALI